VGQTAFSRTIIARKLLLQQFYNLRQISYSWNVIRYGIRDQYHIYSNIPPLLCVKLDPQFFETSWQRAGSGTQKISGALCRNRPGKKDITLKCSNGVRHEKHEVSLIYENRKYLVAYKKAGRGCGDRLLQLFCRTAAHPLPDFYKSVGQV